MGSEFSLLLTVVLPRSQLMRMHFLKSLGIPERFPSCRCFSAGPGSGATREAAQPKGTSKN